MIADKKKLEKITKELQQSMIEIHEAEQEIESKSVKSGAEEQIEETESVDEIQESEPVEQQDEVIPEVNLDELALPDLQENKKPSQNYDFAIPESTPKKGENNGSSLEGSPSQSVSQDTPLSEEKSKQSEHQSELTSTSKKDTQQDDDDDIFAFIDSSKPQKYDVDKLDAVKALLLTQFDKDFENSFNMYQNYPVQELIINSVRVCIEDDNKLIKRGILDLLLSHFE